MMRRRNTLRKAEREG